MCHNPPSPRKFKLLICHSWNFKKVGLSIIIDIWSRKGWTTRGSSVGNPNILSGYLEIDRWVYHSSPVYWLSFPICGLPFPTLLAFPSYGIGSLFQLVWGSLGSYPPRLGYQKKKEVGKDDLFITCLSLHLSSQWHYNNILFLSFRFPLLWLYFIL